MRVKEELEEEGGLGREWKRRQRSLAQEPMEIVALLT